jgi:hypothetical protein
MHLYGHPIRTEQDIDDFGRSDIKVSLVGTPINFDFVVREVPGFRYEKI